MSNQSLNRVEMRKKEARGLLILVIGTSLPFLLVAIIMGG